MTGLSYDDDGSGDLAGALRSANERADATRQMANEANGRLRTRLLNALGLEDDGVTPLTGYVDALLVERDGLRRQLDEQRAVNHKLALLYLDGTPEEPAEVAPGPPDMSPVRGISITRPAQHQAPDHERPIRIAIGSAAHVDLAPAEAQKLASQLAAQSQRTRLHIVPWVKCPPTCTECPSDPDEFMADARSAECTWHAGDDDCRCPTRSKAGSA